VSDTADQLDLPGALRALRRRADLSQRELAARSGVPPGTVGSIESGGSPNPRFQTVERLVAAAGARLAIVDIDGSEPVRLPTDASRDQADRRFPPHLDLHPYTWRGIGPATGFGFVRNRRYRDYNRRCAADERREGVTYDIRRLGPGDATALEAIRASARDLDPAGRGQVDRPPLSDAEALRYLRDPSLRHWIAEQHVSHRILGHLAARVHDHCAGRPVIAVVEVGVRPEYRDGLVGIGLVAALGGEAAKLGVDDVVAMTDEPATARYLRDLGFRRRPRRPPLLTLPW
jgi:transcriptional regulator with XRE-family HTH domain